MDIEYLWFAWFVVLIVLSLVLYGRDKSITVTLLMMTLISAIPGAMAMSQFQIIPLCMVLLISIINVKGMLR